MEADIGRSSAGAGLATLLRRIDQRLLENEGYRLYFRPEECVVVLHVHVLNSQVALIRRLLSLGFKPEQIFVLPKVYSTIKTAKKSIQDLGCKVLDVSL